MRLSKSVGRGSFSACSGMESEGINMIYLQKLDNTSGKVLPKLQLRTFILHEVDAIFFYSRSDRCYRGVTSTGSFVTLLGIYFAEKQGTKL